MQIKKTPQSYMFKLFRKEKPSIKVVTKTSRSPISPISSKLTPQAILYTEYIKNIINNEQINIGLELLNNTKLTIYRKTKLYNLLVINNIKKEQLKYVSEPDPFFWSRICKIIRDMKFITSDNSTCTIGEFMDDNWSNNEASYIYDKYNEIEIKPGVKIKNSVDNIKAIKTVLTNMMNNPYQTINNFLTKEIAPNQINTLFSEYIQEIYGFNKSKLKLQQSNLMHGGDIDRVFLLIDAYKSESIDKEIVCLFCGNYNMDTLRSACNDYKRVIEDCLYDLNKCINVLTKEDDNITNIFELIDYFIDSINIDNDRNNHRSNNTNELLDFIIEKLYGINKTDYVSPNNPIGRIEIKLYDDNMELIKKMFSLETSQQHPVNYLKTFETMITDDYIANEMLLDSKLVGLLPSIANEMLLDSELVGLLPSIDNDANDANDLLKAFYDLINIKECIINNDDKIAFIMYAREHMPEIKEKYKEKIKNFKTNYKEKFEQLKKHIDEYADENKKKQIRELPMYKWIASLFDDIDVFGKNFIKYIILYYQNKLDNIADKKSLDIELIGGDCYILKKYLIEQENKYKVISHFKANIVYDYINKDIKKITSPNDIVNLKILKTYISIPQFMVDKDFPQNLQTFLDNIERFKKNATQELKYVMDSKAHHFKYVPQDKAAAKKAKKVSAQAAPAAQAEEAALTNLEYITIIKSLIKLENKKRINDNILEQSKIGELLYTTNTLKDKKPEDKKIFDIITNYFEIIKNTNIRLRKKRLNNCMSSKLDILNIQAMQPRSDPSLNIKYNGTPKNKNNIVINLLKTLTAQLDRTRFTEFDVYISEEVNREGSNIKIIKNVTEPIENEFDKYIKNQYPDLCEVLNDKWLINEQQIEEMIKMIDPTDYRVVRPLITGARNIHTNDITITEPTETTETIAPSIKIESCKKILTTILNRVTDLNEAPNSSYSDLSELLTNLNITFNVKTLNKPQYNQAKKEKDFNEIVQSLMENVQTKSESKSESKSEPKSKPKSLASTLDSLNTLHSNFADYLNTLTQNLKAFQTQLKVEKEDKDDIVQGSIIVVTLSTIVAMTVLPASFMQYVKPPPVVVPKSYTRQGIDAVLNVGVNLVLANPMRALTAGIVSWAGWAIWNGKSVSDSIGNVRAIAPYTAKLARSVGKKKKTYKKTYKRVIIPAAIGAALISGLTNLAPARESYKKTSLELTMKDGNLSTSNTTLNTLTSRPLESLSEYEQNALKKARDTVNELKPEVDQLKLDLANSEYNCDTEWARFGAQVTALVALAVGTRNKGEVESEEKAVTALRILEKEAPDLTTILESLKGLFAIFQELSNLNVANNIQNILTGGQLDTARIEQEIKVKMDIEFREEIRKLKDSSVVDMLLINSIFNILKNKEQPSFLYYIWIKAHYIITSRNPDKMAPCIKYNEKYIKKYKKVYQEAKTKKYSENFKKAFEQREKLITLLTSVDKIKTISEDDATQLITKIDNILTNNDKASASKPSASKPSASESSDDKKTSGGLSSGERILKQGKHKLSRRKIAIHYKGSRGASRQKNTKRKSKIKLNNKTRKQRKIHYRTQKQKKINNKTRKQRKKYNSRKQKKNYKKK